MEAATKDQHRKGPFLLSVVAPVFNEMDGVEELVTRLGASCRAVSDRIEVILVNDGSRDATLQR